MPRILVVEDEPEHVRLLQRFLGTDHELTVATTAHEGLEKYAQVAPDLLILDIRLPDYSGFGLLQRLHRLNEKPPVIVLTAFHNEINAATAMKLGCFACIDKRDANLELFSAVEEVLSGRPKVSYSLDPNLEPSVEDIVRGLSPQKRRELLVALQAAIARDNRAAGEEGEPEGIPEVARLRLLPTADQEAQIQKLLQFYESCPAWLDEVVAAAGETSQKALHERYYNELTEKYPEIHTQHIIRALGYYTELLKRREGACEPRAWEVPGKFAIFDSKSTTIIADDLALTLSLPPREVRRTRVEFSASPAILQLLPKTPKTLIRMVWDDEGYWLEIPTAPYEP